MRALLVPFPKRLVPPRPFARRQLPNRPPLPSTIAPFAPPVIKDVCGGLAKESIVLSTEAQVAGACRSLVGPPFEQLNEVPFLSRQPLFSTLPQRGGRRGHPSNFWQNSVPSLEPTQRGH
jgi:hypothetical protein